MINDAQKSIIEGILSNGVSGPLDAIREKIKEKQKNPQHGISPQDAILALQAILLRGALSPELQTKLQRLDLLGEVEEARKILAHPAPQNRAGTILPLYKINFKNRPVAEVTGATDFIFNGIKCHFDIQQEKVFTKSPRGNSLELPGLKVQKFNVWQGKDKQLYTEEAGLLGLTARDNTPDAPKINKQDVVVAIHNVVQKEIDVIKKEHSIQHVEPLVPAPTPQAEPVAVEAQPEPVEYKQEPEMREPAPQPRPERVAARERYGEHIAVALAAANSVFTHMLEEHMRHHAVPSTGVFVFQAVVITQARAMNNVMNSTPEAARVRESQQGELTAHQRRAGFEQSVAIAVKVLGVAARLSFFGAHAVEQQAAARAEQRFASTPTPNHESWAAATLDESKNAQSSRPASLSEMLQRAMRTTLRP